MTILKSLKYLFEVLVNFSKIFTFALGVIQALRPHLFVSLGRISDRKFTPMLLPVGRDSIPTAE